MSDIYKICAEIPMATWFSTKQFNIKIFFIECKNHHFLVILDFSCQELDKWEFPGKIEPCQFIEK